MIKPQLGGKEDSNSIRVKKRHFQSPLPPPMPLLPTPQSQTQPCPLSLYPTLFLPSPLHPQLPLLQLLIPLMGYHKSVPFRSLSALNTRLQQNFKWDQVRAVQECTGSDHATCYPRVLAVIIHLPDHPPLIWTTVVAPAPVRPVWDVGVEHPHPVAGAVLPNLNLVDGEAVLVESPQLGLDHPAEALWTVWLGLIHEHSPHPPRLYTHPFAALIVLQVVS